MVDKPVNQIHLCHKPQLPALGEVISATLKEKSDIWPHLEHCFVFFSAMEKDVEGLERIQIRATKMNKGLGSCHARKD